MMVSRVVPKKEKDEDVNENDATGGRKMVIRQPRPDGQRARSRRLPHTALSTLKSWGSEARRE